MKIKNRYSYFQVENILSHYMQFSFKLEKEFQLKKKWNILENLAPGVSNFRK